MKASMILSPLAFAMAAVLATSAFAGKNPPGNPPPVTSASGSSATVTDTQNNYDNEVTNEGTQNNALIDSSLNGVSGNVGANVAAGDNNQQANAAAIATADAAFVFGAGSAQGNSAQASITVDQQGYDNTLTNSGNANNAAIANSGWGAQGNIGVNAAAGNFNQQKNDLAIASSETAYTAGATVDVLQESHGNVTENSAGDVYEVADGLGVVAAGRGGSHNPPTQPNDPSEDPVAQTPVVNNATLYSSFNDASGNVGINIAAGGGNQQNNSLAIAAGCSACPSGL
ncbi:hypothetical protein [Pseudomonas sp. 5P_3.1_Bac2]|uniref:hypothetical protein n=1 Tax=Pseudomonas sp. 5P_3.1_Bac2 TaxID=2971617 RepID=UPI0021C879FB|nr:hypothetical protein [Pseudomonas sp. 5P_3.1_Bac2]MCU1718558.1 hypothetical protein [Pseudomonas sp. 5P_3.1_Bac2]